MAINRNNNIIEHPTASFKFEAYDTVYLLGKTIHIDFVSKLFNS